MEPFEELAGLDRLIHEPSRLAIMTVLQACQVADFLFLQRVTGLTKGNLSSHLSKLESGGLVEINKRFVGKLPNTMITLTPVGQDAVEAHWRQLERLRRDTQEWQVQH